MVYLGLFSIISLVLLAYAFENKDKLKVKSINQINFKNNILKNVMYNVANKFSPPTSWKMYQRYHIFLRYLGNIDVEKFFRIKFYVAVVTIIFIFLIQQTNISINLGNVYNEVRFRLDPIYANTDRTFTKDQEREVFDTEIGLLKAAINAGYLEIVEVRGKIDSETSIKGFLGSAYKPVHEVSTEEMANRIYYRLKKHNEAKSIDISTIILIVFVIYFVPDAIVYIFNFFAAVDAKKELKFLKKLIIMNGSIKPVDFMELLRDLIAKSKYHKTMLKDIEDLNKRNYVDNRSIYKGYIQNAKDINVKLFYEKLDEANNYDFDQAILNIKNEFELEKRVEARDIRKKIEIIHTMGITGFMVMTLLIIMYMLIPWLSTYDIGQFTF